MAVRIRHAGRYRSIAMALMHHGFGYMVEELGLYHLLSLPRRLVTQEAHTSLTLGERIRLVLEDLGPTFIKLGQLASTRSDLLPIQLYSNKSGRTPSPAFFRPMYPLTR